jgi:hypothetical protein
MFFQNKETDSFYKMNGLYKIRDINSHYLDYTPKNCHRGLQLDIFVHRLSNKNVIIPIHTGRVGDLGEHMYEDIFPLATGKFEDLEVYIPGNYVGICKQFWKDFPPKVLDVKDRRPHEGNMISDKPHPNDLIQYKKMYDSIAALSSSPEVVFEQVVPVESLPPTCLLRRQESLQSHEELQQPVAVDRQTAKEAAYESHSASTEDESFAYF